MNLVDKVSRNHFYEDVVINGSLTFEGRDVNGKNITVNGSLTQKEGGIRANLLINPNGVLNIDSPLFPVDVNTVTNKGIINWIKGEITGAGGVFTNDGIERIS